jgi:hypothetical protein
VTTTTKITEPQKQTIAHFAVAATRLRWQGQSRLADEVLALGRRWWVAQGA